MEGMYRSDRCYQRLVVVLGVDEVPLEIRESPEKGYDSIVQHLILCSSLLPIYIN